MLYHVDKLRFLSLDGRHLAYLEMYRSYGEDILYGTLLNNALHVACHHQRIVLYAYNFVGNIYHSRGRDVLCTEAVGEAHRKS